MIQNVISLLSERRAWFLNLLGQHLAIAAIAIASALILGLAIGIFISEHQKGSKFILSFVNFLYTIPSISLLGFLIPLSGIGNTTAVIALTIYALLPMVRNTHTGLTNVDEKIVEAARGMGSTPNQILWKVKLPLALPVIVSGIRSMTTMTIALGGIASFIGAGGLGVALYRGITTNNPAMTMAGSLLIAVLAITLDLILSLVEKSTQAKYRKQKKRNLVTAAVASAIVALLILSSLQFASANIIIKVATKPMTEQYIIGNMLKIMIQQDSNLEVELTTGVGGGTSNIHPAMVKGEFDLYPEYTGTGWNMVLKNGGVYNETLFAELEKGYEDLGLLWKGMYGFNNTFGIAVTQEVADEYNLKTFSDLAKVSDQLSFGASYDFFEREDGFNALKLVYGMNFASTKDMDIGLTYQAIKERQLDAMIVFTTDGQLASSGVVVLEDDKGLYPSYLCGNVIRSETLLKHPELVEVLLKFENLISDADMSVMNNKVESMGMQPEAAAAEFLSEKGLLAKR